MLRRFTIRLRTFWDKLPMQLSIFSWPPLLSHCLAFILGTLVLRSGSSAAPMPTGKILIPIDKLARLEMDVQSFQTKQKWKIVARKGEQWCRLSDDGVALWKAPGKSAGTYVQWPASALWTDRLQPALQKKYALTTETSKLAFCGVEKKPTHAPDFSGIIYD